MTRVVTFRVDEDLLDLLDKYAIRKRISRSEAIRLAIENLVKDDEANKETRVLAVDFW